MIIERNKISIGLIINETAQKLIEEKQVDFVKPFDEKGKTPVEKVFDENNN